MATATTADTERTTERRFTTVHNRYHIICSCCGLVKTEQRKRYALEAMIGHMGRHTENQTFAVYDSMHRGGPRTVYGGRIHNGVQSHGIGVGYKVGAE